MPRVLVVEDNRDIALLFSRMLCEYEVTTVHTVTEAFAEPDTFDCIVADLHLPDGDGLDLLTMEVPVVVVTADARPKTRDGAMKAGAAAFLLKPDDVPRLGRIVADAILKGELDAGQR